MSVEIAKYNTEWKQDRDLVISLKFENEDGTDFTDFVDSTFYSELRDKQNISGTLYSTGVIDATNIATGILLITFPKADRAAITGSIGYWDLAETSTAGLIDTIVEGRVTFDGSVTDV
jgi:hypothetical protein